MIDANIPIEIATKSAAEIMKIYQEASYFHDITFKNDHSPLTLADKASHDMITSSLKKYFPHFPIISEEQSNADYNTRKNWTTYWLIDPLDGTKEFIHRTGEFTINIALMHERMPVFGLIYVPVQQTCYYNIDGIAYKMKDGNTTKIKVAHKKSGYFAVGSRSHASEKETFFLQKYDIMQHIAVGSSLKFCYVAEGLADIYYREGPTMEWDTAAGHSIVLAAGGRVEGLEYNKKDMLNGSFCCYGF